MVFVFGDGAVLKAIDKFGDPTALVDLVIFIFEIFDAGVVVFELTGAILFGAVLFEDAIVSVGGGFRFVMEDSFGLFKHYAVVIELLPDTFDIFAHLTFC